MGTQADIDARRSAIMELIEDAYRFLGRDLTPTTAFVLLGDLEHFEIRDIARALAQHRHDPERGRFPPVTADLMRYLQEPPETRAQRAWQLAYAAASSVGKYTAVAFADDPAAMVAVKAIGGWPRLCALTEADLPFRQREFVKAYVGAVTSPLPAAMVPTYLPGINTDGELVIIRSDFSRARSSVELLAGPASGRVGGVVAMLTQHVTRGRQ